MSTLGIFAAVRNSAEERRNPAALVTDDHAWSLLQLLAAAEAFADRLALRNPPHGLVVAELSDPAATAVVALGCDLAGVTLVHRDPESSRPTGGALRLGHLLVHDGRTRPPAPGEIAWSEVLQLWGAPTDTATPVSPPARVDASDHGENTATVPIPPGSQIFLTSGSTGTPAGVVRTADSILADARRVGEFLGYGPRSPIVSAAPCFHVYGFNYGLMAPLLLGAPVRCCAGRSVPSQLARAVKETGARTLIALPLHYGLIGAAGDGTPESGAQHPARGGAADSLSGLTGLHQAVSAGAPLSAGVATHITGWFSFRLHNCYGSSEAGAVTLKRMTGDEAVNDIGRPLPGIDARIEEGELHLRSSSLAVGRTTLEDMTMTPLRAGSGWYPTGDLAESGGTTPGGYRLRGRTGSLINVAGEKVNPAEVERVLQTHPAVAEVQVLAAPDAKRGQVPVARVVLRDDVPLPRLIGWCRENLAPHQVPRKIHLVTELPRSATGKPVVGRPHEEAPGDEDVVEAPFSKAQL